MAQAQYKHNPIQHKQKHKHNTTQHNTNATHTNTILDNMHIIPSNACVSHQPWTCLPCEAAAHFTQVVKCYQFWLLRRLGNQLTIHEWDRIKTAVAKGVRMLMCHVWTYSHGSTCFHWNFAKFNVTTLVLGKFGLRPIQTWFGLNCKPSLGFRLGKSWLKLNGSVSSLGGPNWSETVPNQLRIGVMISLFASFVAIQFSSKMVQKWVRYDPNNVLVS
jgi:hypothetical protein